MLYILLILFILIFYLAAEYFIHLFRLQAIPIRIHVNGTRGKSSVTRLIAGALREQGIRTIAKTTGTLPKVIMEDGREYPIHRPGGANIIEQLRIVSFAALNNAEALVVECMAVQPQYQSLTERKLIKSTHGVITNARADHLDVMGPTEMDVALALLGTVPIEGRLYTAERDYVEQFEGVCKDRESELHLVREKEINDVTDEDLKGFNYVEHKDNIALVLKVCASLGVSKEVALQGMWKAKRDPGAMSEIEIEFYGRKILLINGFAANDPESSEQIWKMALNAHTNYEKRIMVISARIDRPDRSRQLGQAITTWPMADGYVIIGSGVYLLFKAAVECGMDPAKLVCAEGFPVEKVFEEVVAQVSSSALVMGIGNIVGPGMELVNFFHNRKSVK